MTNEEHSEDIDLSSQNNKESDSQGDSQTDNESNDSQSNEDNQDNKDSGSDYRAKLNAQNRFLEKEGYKFEGGKWVKPKAESRNEGSNQQNNQGDNLSTKDVLALTENKISVDDYDEVVRVAKILNKPLNEALKDKTLKTILSVRAEERRTSETTITNRSGRGGSKSDGTSLLEHAEATGEIPTTPAEIRKMAEARIARQKSKRQ